MDRQLGKGLAKAPLQLRMARYQSRKKWNKIKPAIAKTVWVSLIIAVTIAGIVSILMWANWLPEWTGIGAYESQTTTQTGTSITTQTTITRGKTFWDFMELLLVPVVLALAAIWFNKRMRNAEQNTTEERLREDALQTYFDRMSELSLDHNLYKADKNSDVRYIARARTLNVFQRLDGPRKGIVLNFLYSLGLIGCKMGDNWRVDTYPIIALSEADLSGLSVPGGALTFATLKNVFLQDVHLSGADLNHVDLSEAVLASCWLDDVDLRDAKLGGANLEIAFLVGARLDRADLSGANLTNAFVTSEQLSRAKSLEGCVMPSGILYDPQEPLDAQCEPRLQKGTTA